MSRLNITALMNEVKEEVKKVELYEVVIDGTSVGKFTEEKIIEIATFIASIEVDEKPKAEKPVAKSSKAAEAAAIEKIEKEIEKEQSEAPKNNYEWAKRQKDNVWTSDLVVVSKDYKARFNYGLIRGMSKDKETGKFSQRKFEYMKRLFSDQIKEFGAKWVDNKANDEFDFGWYQLPNKKDAWKYINQRKEDDKKYAKN